MFLGRANGKRYLALRGCHHHHTFDHYQNLYNLIISYISSKSTELQHHGFQRNSNNKIIQYDEREEVPPYCSFSIGVVVLTQMVWQGQKRRPLQLWLHKDLHHEIPKGMLAQLLLSRNVQTKQPKFCRIRWNNWCALFFLFFLNE